MGRRGPGIDCYFAVQGSSGSKRKGNGNVKHYVQGGREVMTTKELAIEKIVRNPVSFLSNKAQRNTEEFHKTSTYLAEQARQVEKAMERKKWAR